MRSSLVLDVADVSGKAVDHISNGQALACFANEDFKIWPV
jgi:hypothetical protein